MTASAQSPARAAKPAPQPRNGVNVPALFATIDVVAQQPQLAKFDFRATTRWVKGTHARTTIDAFSGAGAEHTHKQAHSYDADHPAVLVGEDNAPTPMEFVLHALGSCLMAGVASIAAARRVDLHEVVAKIEGKADLRGVLGLSDQVRNGFESIRVSFSIKGDAPADKLQQIIEQSRNRSAVFDIVTHGVPVEIVVNAN
jgi:uncharacterized OsmC-like protein